MSIYSMKNMFFENPYQKNNLLNENMGFGRQ